MKSLNRIQEQSGVKILCALKGFSMWSTFPIIKKFLSGATASSLNEVKLCNEELGEKAHSCFVVYEEEEFEEVLSMSSHVSFNSLNQYEKFKNYIPLHPSVQFGFRINPNYSPVKTAKYNPCMPGSRFGILMNELPKELPQGISGIHFHSLCESGANELNDVLNVMESDIGHILHQCEWVNMGGGHHITREDYDKDYLITILNNFRQNYNTAIFLEPGEAIGWQSGVLLSKIEDIVVNQGNTTAILNVSFSAHMPDCLEMPYKPVVVGESRHGKEYTFGGNTCLSGDFVSGFYFENDLSVGDHIIFTDMMHYSFVKNTTFNGVNLPSLAFVNENGEFKIQKEFSYLDFKNRLS